MARTRKGFNVDVALKDVGGRELVVCSLKNVGQWHLTSDEARIVAIKLIAVVNPSFSTRCWLPLILAVCSTQVADV